MKPQSNKTKKKFIRHLIEISLLILVVWGISSWREQHLLNNQEVANSPQMQLTSLQGESYTLASKQNKQLIYFFAPWCNICHLSIGNIEAQKNQLAEKNIQVLYVALSWQTRQEIEDFVAEHELTFPVLMGTPEVAHNYRVKGFPTYYLLNEEGVAIEGSQGYSTEFGVWMRSL